MTRRPGTLKAFGVADLGFGDGGKGLLTDYLTRHAGADVVVRFNGGAQAGHNVVTPEGRHHTFAQFGAGSFCPGVRTFLSRHVVVHPTALLREASSLADVGVPDAMARLAVSEGAPLITPFHQAANRLRELSRGGARHGSCGVGVGEAVRDAQAHPEDVARAGDLRDPTALARRLTRIRERVLVDLRDTEIPRSAESDLERRAFEAPGLERSWCEQAAPLAPHVVPDDELKAWLARSRAVVFEGAQGLLLDERVGFHPHTTWSRCTLDAAVQLLAEAAPGVPLRVWGVLRAHAVRHGPGPLPTESDDLRGLVHEHNETNPWQGPVRYGWFDAVLARYALALTHRLDALVLTHVDRLSHRQRWNLCGAYGIPPSLPVDLVVSEERGRARDLVAIPEPTIERQARLGALLRSCQPELENCAGEEGAYLARVEALLGRSVDGITRGPTAADVALRSSAVLSGA